MARRPEAAPAASHAPARPGSSRPTAAFPYATPEALRAAVADRAKAAAPAGSPHGIDELYRRFAYDRLLARLYLLDPDRWALKGAVGLLLRLPEMRHTLDLDLATASHDRDAAALEQATKALERAARADLGDHVRFTVGPWRLGGTLSGRPLAQATVTCWIGLRRLVAFPIDLVGGDLPPLALETAAPLRPFDLPGLPSPPHVLVYPLAAQVAEKVCGILSRHGEVPSTRYRDLADLAAIAQAAELAAGDLHTALQHEFARQGLPPPAELTVPDPVSWAAGYTELARRLPRLRDLAFPDALALVKRLIDPVLAGRRHGRWLPSQRAWEPLLAAAAPWLCACDGAARSPRRHPWEPDQPPCGAA